MKSHMKREIFDYVIENLRQSASRIQNKFVQSASIAGFSNSVRYSLLIFF